MEYILDTHTHTLASGHAYNTIMEMAKAASDKGLKFLGITEHSVKMPGTCEMIYFTNLTAVDRNIYGVELAMGVEANIIDFDGNVDMKPEMLQKMDIVIASFHNPCLHPGTYEENTNALLKCCENPLINILGHPDDAAYPIDFEKVVTAAKETHTLIEINNSSLTPGCYRRNTWENDTAILKLCMKYNADVVIGSDAHFVSKVGAHDYAMKLMDSLDFPKSLVMNYDLEKLKTYINKYKQACIV